MFLRPFTSKSASLLTGSAQSLTYAKVMVGVYTFISANILIVTMLAAYRSQGNSNQAIAKEQRHPRQ